MTADVPTLLLMIIVTSLVTSGALLVLNGNQRNDGLQYWAGGLLLSALAHTLLLLYGCIPYLLTIVLGNALLSSALAGFWLAVRRFHGLALHWARTLAPVTVIAVLMWLFQHQFASRVVVSGFMLSLQAALVLWVLRQRSLGAPQQRSRGALLLVCGLGLIVLTMLLRAGAALFFSLNIASILQSNLVQTLTFMVSFLATLVSSFGFVFMAKERADQANLRLASQDPLTGAANRRALMQALETELARASRQHTPLALLMVDIDHFKRVNDHYGHLAGDHVLRQRLRAPDVLGRYGGEEFMVLLPGTGLHGAAQLAEHLRQAVQAAPCEWQGQRIPFTVSIGVAASADTPADPSRTSEALLQAADQALYRAKDDGRNRVALA